MRFSYTLVELRHLNYFVMTAEEGSVNRASKRLFVSQPAVSRQIRDLEDELGVLLFFREPTGLSLTPAGEIALLHARDILMKAEGLQTTLQTFASSHARHRLKVGYLPTALPGFLATGMRRFKQQVTGVELQISEMSPVEQEQALRNGEIDLGLIGDPEDHLRREFQVEHILKTEMAMLVPEDHPLATRKTVSLAAFGNDHFATLSEKKFPGRSAMMQKFFAKAGIAPEIVCAAEGLSELLGLIGAGDLVALAPADLKQLPHRGVCFLPLKQPRQTLYFSAMWRTGDESQGLRELVALMKPSVAD
ncbi:MAG: LysR substrate-binding domain-containing protein [Verrucomicrobiota bacterium]